MKGKIYIAIALFGLSVSKVNSQINKPEIMGTKSVAIVKVKAPLKAFNFILRKKFKEAIPVYQKIDGLLFKAFTINKNDNGKNFGGIYLWDTEQNARNWFNPEWFENVERLRHTVPSLEYYQVIKDTSFLPNVFDYDKIANCRVLHIHSISVTNESEYSTKYEGLFRSYLVSEKNEGKGAILFFLSKKEANSFIKEKSIKTYDWFKAPVILNNGENK